MSLLSSALSSNVPCYVELYMQIPYYLVLYMQSVLIIYMQHSRVSLRRSEVAVAGCSTWVPGLRPGSRRRYRFRAPPRPRVRNRGFGPTI